MGKRLDLLKEHAYTLARFAEDPGGYIWGYVIGFIFTGIAAMVDSTYGAVRLLFFGSDPKIWAGSHETWGLADIFPGFARIVGMLLRDLIETLFGVLETLFLAVVPDLPGPITGVIVTLAATLVVGAAIRATLTYVKRGG